MRIKDLNINPNLGRGNRNKKVSRLQRRRVSSRIASNKGRQRVTTITGDYVLNYRTLDQHMKKVKNRITKKTF